MNYMMNHQPSVNDDLDEDRELIDMIDRWDHHHGDENRKDNAAICGDDEIIGETIRKDVRNIHIRHEGDYEPTSIFNGSRGGGAEYDMKFSKTKTFTPPLSSGVQQFSLSMDNRTFKLQQVTSSFDKIDTRSDSAIEFCQPAPVFLNDRAPIGYNTAADTMQINDKDFGDLDTTKPLPLPLKNRTHTINDVTLAEEVEVGTQQIVEPIVNHQKIISTQWKGYDLNDMSLPQDQYYNGGMMHHQSAVSAAVASVDKHINSIQNKASRRCSMPSAFKYDADAAGSSSNDIHQTRIPSTNGVNVCFSNDDANIPSSIKLFSNSHQGTIQTATENIDFTKRQKQQGQMEQKDVNNDESEEKESPSFYDMLMNDRLHYFMSKSEMSQKSLQNFDKHQGLPKNHSPTMINTSRSRTQLQEGVILKTCRGVPLTEAAAAVTRTKKIKQQEKSTIRIKNRVSRRGSCPY